MAYSDITSAETDPESPVTTTLMVKYVNNLLQVEQWIRDRLDDQVVSNWRAHASGTTMIWDLGYDNVNGRWVLISTAGGGNIRWSDDEGVTWTAAAVGPGSVPHGVDHDGTALWVAVGLSPANQGVWTSADGDTWAPQQGKLGVGGTARGVTHGSGTWVLVGNAGKISSSPDGINWTAQASGVGTTLWNVTYGDGLFVAVGAAGVILTSPDGAAPWTARVSGFGASDVYDVAFDGSMFVAVGQAAKYSTSPDGITWSIGDSGIGAGNNLFGVHYDSGRWVAVADNGAVISSPNGTVWTPRPTVVGANLLRCVMRDGAGSWLVGGDNASIYGSVIDPNRQIIP
jgi:hypothetical protein